MARQPRVHERWAHLRFSIIGQLLAAPPPKGELRAAIESLAERTWVHASTGEPVRFGFSTSAWQAAARSRSMASRRSWNLVSASSVAYKDHHLVRKLLDRDGQARTQRSLPLRQRQEVQKVLLDE
jgi:hypothetical protein